MATATVHPDRYRHQCTNRTHQAIAASRSLSIIGWVLGSLLSGSARACRLRRRQGVSGSLSPGSACCRDARPGRHRGWRLGSPTSTARVS